MKLGLIHLSMSFAAVAVAIASPGCSGATSGPLNSNTPHALGIITVGESHTSGEQSFTPQIFASFIPDASQATQCPATSIGGCTIAVPAVCNGITGPLCQADQFCTLDATCKPICQAACTAVCPAGEECYFPTPSTQSCQPIQTFDAGDLVLAGPGISSPVTLVPPEYALTNPSIQNPLVWGQQIQVTSSGSTGAGFQAFQETFKATTLLQTSPSISTLTPADVYSAAGLTLGWTAGSDAIVISVTGPQGTASCPANDAAGLFTVPEAVVLAVAGTGTPAISISVARQHLEEKTDAKTQGTLSEGVTVQPVGFLDLSSVSIETTTVAGCAPGTAMCSDGCANLLTSNTDCGACGNSCGTGVCEDGTCSGTCTSPLTSCSGVCVNLLTSPTNCGECGFACPSTESCSNGECLASTTCSAGYTSCADGCQDLLISNTDCGECGLACPSTESCSIGECTASTTCSAGYTSCADGCQDLLTSSTDCGACGTSCDGAACTDGVCPTSTTCTTCESTAESGTCASAWDECSEDANCADFESCMSGCASGDPTCQETCEEDYSTGATEAQNLQTCVCQTACESSCGTTTYCTQTL